MKKPHCCEIDCTEDATFQIVYGNAPSDQTESCDKHIAALIADNVESAELYRLNP